MSYMDTYRLWREKLKGNEELYAELCAIEDKREIEDRFYQKLEFGAGGLRGVLGTGTNRRNVCTVVKATQGYRGLSQRSLGSASCQRAPIFPVRLSGTEPKLKIYLTSLGQSREKSREIADRLGGYVQTGAGR